MFDIKNECSKCNKIFQSKKSLNVHEKTSKCHEKKIEKIFNCIYCTKNFSTNQMLKYHIDTCVEKKISDIKNEYEIKIHDLQKKYEDQIVMLKSKDIEDLTDLCKNCIYNNTSTYYPMKNLKINTLSVSSINSQNTIDDYKTVNSSIV